MIMENKCYALTDVRIYLVPRVFGDVIIARGSERRED